MSYIIIMVNKINLIALLYRIGEYKCLNNIMVQSNLVELKLMC